MGQCLPCLHTCSDCVSRTNCTKCPVGLYLQHGQCQTGCTKGYYSDRGVCLSCHLSCATCSGPRPDQCVTCPPKWHLANGYCKAECPKGYYRNEYGCHKCHQYDTFCNNCIGKWKIVDGGGKVTVQYEKVVCIVLHRKSNRKTWIWFPVGTLIFVLLPVFLFSDGCKDHGNDNKRRSSERNDRRLHASDEIFPDKIEFINQFNIITSTAVIICVAIIALFGFIFIVLQVSILYTSILPLNIMLHHSSPRKVCWHLLVEFGKYVNTSRISMESMFTLSSSVWKVC